MYSLSEYYDAQRVYNTRGYTVSPTHVSACGTNVMYVTITKTPMPIKQYAYTHQSVSIVRTVQSTVHRTQQQSHVPNRWCSISASSRTSPGFNPDSLIFLRICCTTCCTTSRTNNGVGRKKFRKGFRVWTKERPKTGRGPRVGVWFFGMQQKACYQYRRRVSHFFL